MRVVYRPVFLAFSVPTFQRGHGGFVPEDFWSGPDGSDLSTDVLQLTNFFFVIRSEEADKLTTP